ncbi:MAG: hypothetical protein AAFO77_02300 [Pseudomonadota bacterium]
MTRVPHFRSMLRINITLLYACVLAFVSWVLWPDKAEYWRMGILSFFAGLGAFGFFWRGIGETILHIRTLRQFDQSVAKKRKPHSDTMADGDALQRGGLVD